MRRGLDRRRLLALGASGTVAALLGGGAAAQAADDVYGVDVDVARMRLLATVELVELAYVERAIDGEELLRPGDGRVLRTMRASEHDHYATLAAVLGPDETPTGDDYDVVFPRNSFGSRRRILATGIELHRIAIGAAIGTLSDVARGDLRRLAGQLAAVEATHDAALRRAAGVATPVRELPAPLDADAAGLALARYLRG